MAALVHHMFATITFSVCSPQSAIYSLQFTQRVNFPRSFSRTLNNRFPLCSSTIHPKLQAKATIHVLYTKVHYEHHIIVITS